MSTLSRPLRSDVSGENLSNDFILFDEETVNSSTEEESFRFVPEWQQPETTILINSPTAVSLQASSSQIRRRLFGVPLTVHM